MDRVKRQNPTHVSPTILDPSLLNSANSIYGNAGDNSPALPYRDQSEPCCTTSIADDNDSGCVRCPCGVSNCSFKSDALSTSPKRSVDSVHWTASRSRSPCSSTPNRSTSFTLGTDSPSTTGSSSSKSPIFPSTRFFIAILLCFCFVSLSISTSNISLSVTCMLKKTSASASAGSTPVAIPQRVRRDTPQPRMRKGGDEPDSNRTAYRTHEDPSSECQLARIRKHAPTGQSPESSAAPSANNVLIESCYESEKLEWSSTDLGMVFAAQNAGSLLMLVTGTQADRLNSKWTIVAALVLLVLSNVLLPLLAHVSVWLVVAARVLTGLSDALLQPSTSSMITRWFPPKERPFAIGLITGGRQIGTLLILPVSGFLCSRHDILNGWPAIFYLSALIGTIILMAWLFMSADKPSKHFATSSQERLFVEQKIAEEKLGKRRERKAVPWRHIVRCRPLYAGVAALICHEYPLVIMLQLLPKYLSDVLQLPPVENGIVSALPTGVLFLSKTLSSSLAALLGSRKKGRWIIGRTPLVKIFNGVASLGLGICVGIVPLLHTEEDLVLAVVVLCCANAFAGLHTPGVQTALLQLAPAYTGIVTGIAFGFVAIFSIFNKLLSNYIVKSGSIAEWSMVFWIASVVALLPVVFFTLWGSADRQHWATHHHHHSRRVSNVSDKCRVPPALANMVVCASAGHLDSSSTAKLNQLVYGPFVDPKFAGSVRSSQSVMDEEEEEDDNEEDCAPWPDALSSAIQLNSTFRMFLNNEEGVHRRLARSKSNRASAYIATIEEDSSPSLRPQASDARSMNRNSSLSI